MNKISGILLLTLFLLSGRLLAQHEHRNTQKEKPKDKSHEMQHEGMEMQGMQHEANPASGFLMNEGAGTATNPERSPMHMNFKFTCCC